MSVMDLIQSGQLIGCAPWPRILLTQQAWATLASLPPDETVDLIALWADTAQVHALFAGPLLVSTTVEDGAYPALSPWRPAAAAFERMVQDLWGHAATGAVDTRPWLDHGVWDMAHPMAIRPLASLGRIEPTLRPGPDGLHQLPIGPIRPGIAEPVHWRLHAAGEAVRQAEVRLGYAHKGTLVMMRAKSPRIAARFAARMSGDATVAHSVAFAHAAEAALGISASPRAYALRAIMAEIERIAVHLDTLGGLCAAAGFALGAAAFGQQREMLMVAAGEAFGHRLMMDAVVPGGVATDVTPIGLGAIGDALVGLDGLPALYRAALTDRLVGLGRVAVGDLAPGGVTGRAAGRAGDARIVPGYPPYTYVVPAVPVLAAGDVDARARIRLAEIIESAALLRRLLATLPDGPFSVALPSISGEGLGVAESARGDVWYWLRLDGGMIAAAFAADPSWRLFPLAEQALADGGVGDADLILRSFDASVSGVDL